MTHDLPPLRDHPAGELLTEHSVVDYLAGRGVLPGEYANVAALGGGVSNVAGRLPPGFVPPVVDSDPQTCAVVIEAAPATWSDWKTCLLAGDLAHACAVTPIQHLLVLPLAASSMADAVSAGWHVRWAATELLRRYAGTFADLIADELIDVLSGWVDEFGIVSLEDPLREDDWDGWVRATGTLAATTQPVGDDLFVTDATRLRRGIDAGIATAILVKANQAGTLSDPLGHPDPSRGGAPCRRLGALRRYRAALAGRPRGCLRRRPNQGRLVDSQRAHREGEPAAAAGVLAGTPDVLAAFVPTMTGPRREWETTPS